MTATILVLLMLGLPEGGEPAARVPSSGVAVSGANSVEVSRAESLFRAGVAAFDRHDYAAAVKLFEDAYQVSKTPAILFDIGQAYRSLGDCQRALDAYEAFTRAADSNDPLIPRVRARQAELKSCVRPSPAKAAEGSPAAHEGAPAKPVLAALPAKSSSPAPILLGAPASGGGGKFNLRTTCVAAASASAAVGVVGMTLGLRSWSLANQVEGAQEWDSAAQRADERGRAYADAATSLLIVAGAAAAITTAGCWWGWRATRDGTVGRTTTP